MSGYIKALMEVARAHLALITGVPSEEIVTFIDENAVTVASCDIGDVEHFVMVSDTEIIAGRHVRGSNVWITVILYEVPSE